MTTISVSKQFAEQRLSNAISLVSALEAGEWPYEDGRKALLDMLAAYERQLRTLSDLDADADDEVVRINCIEAKSLVSSQTGFMGFILRSSNVRNAFEIYSPIRRLLSQLLQEEARLVIGSEWTYVPFIYPIPNETLPDYVFVGLPASEASNALLLPVAGHEIGHAVWRRTSIGRQVCRQLQKEIVATFVDHWDEVGSLFRVSKSKISKDIDAQSIWLDSFEYAARQCEEVFCDLLGFYIFGTGFIYSFIYLLTPDAKDRVSFYYPSNRSRADFVAESASKLGDVFNGPFQELFSQPKPSEDRMVRLADETTSRMVSFLHDEVLALCQERGLARPDNEACKKAIEEIKHLCPPDASTADVINAAWTIRLQIESWNVPGVAGNRKPDILNDLVFKSFEVAEWHHTQ